jgi:GGDEF domain-containing protein
LTWNTAVVQAVQAMHTCLRSDVLIVRIGGEEFLCVMSGATIIDAQQRFGVVQTSLAPNAAQRGRLERLPIIR